MANIELHERLQQVLESLGWAQERLAREIHSDPATISRWLNGRVKPSKSTQGRIAQATNVDPDWLQTGQGRMRPHDQTEPTGQNIRELLEMTTRILSSSDEYRQTLADNIRMFYRAMNMEDEMRGLEQEVVALRAELFDSPGLSKGRAEHPARSAGRQGRHHH